MLRHIVKLREEKVKLTEAGGRSLSRPLISSVFLPPFNQSAVDRYAFCLKNSSIQQSFHISGEVAAGSEFQHRIKKGEAVRIFTGAAVPDGCDTIVMQEKTTVKEGQLNILDSNLTLGANIRKKGSDVRKGQHVLTSGSVLSPAAIGLIAAIGISEIYVYQRPVVSIIVTGNELKPPGTLLKKGEIYESNAPMLVSALAGAGIKPKEIIRIRDNENALIKAIKGASETSDLLLITGGISVGDYDFTESALSKAGFSKIFYKVKQKPGKPIFFGYNASGNKSGKGVNVFGLPGNPAAVLSCYYEWVYPALRKMQGFREIYLPGFSFPLNSGVKKKPGLTHFLKARAGRYGVEILPGQESYKLGSFAFANALVYLSEDNSDLLSGQQTEVHLFPF